MLKSSICLLFVQNILGFKLENYNSYNKLIDVKNLNGEEGNLFEGDIILVNAHNGIINARSKWTKNAQGIVNIPYVFQLHGYNTNEINLIRSSMDDIQRVSCIRFIPRTNQQDYVEIRNNPGCSSFIGKVGGPQAVTLQANGCLTKGTIIHEFLHALGFWHMQSSEDRDSFVRINYQNISPGSEHNFEKRNTNRFGTPYDYLSVMHYGSLYFSRNGQPTVEPIDRSIPISSLGQRVSMTNGDITRLRSLYQC